MIQKVNQGVQVMTIREELHRLVDRLPEGELDAALRLLEAWHNQEDPVLKALLEAVEDDEPSTPEEDREAQEAWEEYQRGIGKPWEEVKKGLAGG
jgi:hypothetical protein